MTWIVVVLAVWAALHIKTSRSDGELLSVPQYRRLMFYIMPRRNGSVVFFDRPEVWPHIGYPGPSLDNP